MVFYFLVYREVAAKSRKVGEVRLSNGKVLSSVKNFNGLMQQKAMPISAVKFEGWLATPTKEDEDHPLLRDETLAETLARVHKQSEAKLKKLNEKEDKKLKKPKPTQKTIHRDELPASSSEAWSESSIVEPNFKPPMATVTVGTSTNSRGCMRVRTLEESLDSRLRHREARQKANVEGSSPVQSEGKTGTVSTSSTSSSIQFGTVEIRHYLRCLGDNPACSNGPPVSLDWKYRTEGVFPLDEFDDCRIDERREGFGYRISYYDRVEMLRTLGYSRQELMKAEKQRKKDQALREETIYGLKFMERDEKREMVKRQVKRALCITSC